MPVAVIGAAGMIGRSLIPLLSARGSEVRALVGRRDEAEGLRALGGKAAVGEPTDAETLRVVIADAHTVCHLAGSMDLPDTASYERSNLETTVEALAVARRAGVKRFLLLSYPGASSASSNDYLRFTGLAEEAVRDSGLEHLILRSTHAYGEGSGWLRLLRQASSMRRPTVVGSGEQRLAPVFVGDVAAALAAADDRAAAVEGTMALEGPDIVSANELASLLGAGRGRRVYLDPTTPARAARALGRPISGTYLELLAADSLADAPDAAAEFGIERTALSDGLRASGVGAPSLARGPESRA